MSEVIKSLPKLQDKGESVAAVPSVHAAGSISQSSQFPSDDPSMRPKVLVHNVMELQDQRSQQLNVGVESLVFANMVAEPRRIIQECEDKVQGLGLDI